MRDIRVPGIGEGGGGGGVWHCCIWEK